MKTVADILAALALPAQSRLDKRVPKKILAEQGAFAAGDKRKIQDGVDELVWVAALKPSNIAVAEYRDGVREYLEIAVLSAVFRAEAKQDRLVELIHRAIPYPVILIAEQAGIIDISLVQKRASEGETGKVVLDGEIISVLLNKSVVIEQGFMGTLSVTNQPSANLFVLYQGWIDKMTAFKVAQITGSFIATGDSVGRLERFKQYEEIQARIKEIRVSADKERQMNRKVELNIELQRLEAQLKQILETLKR